MKRFAQLLMIAGMLSMFACSSNSGKTEATDSTTVTEQAAPAADTAAPAADTTAAAAPATK